MWVCSMTMLKSLSCPLGSCNGKLRRKHGVVTFSRIRIPVRIGRSRCMGKQQDLVNLRIRNRQAEPRVWRSDMFTVPSGKDSWLGRLLRGEKSRTEGDSQKTAVIDVHLRFSLSKPQNLVDSLAPRWFKGVQTLLPHLVQHGGGGNRDGDFSVRLGYGGDDDSRGNSDKKKKKKLWFYARWAAGVASVSLLVWALGQYSGIPQRTQSSVSQFVDCVVWLGLAWCLAAVSLWAVRMLVSLTPRSRNAFSTGREFVLRSKLDEWMAHNVVAVPGLVVSLFLVCDLVHYATRIFNISNVTSEVSDFFNSRSKRVSRYSREKKGRRGSSRRRP